MGRLEKRDFPGPAGDARNGALREVLAVGVGYEMDAPALLECSGLEDRRAVRQELRDIRDRRVAPLQFGNHARFFDPTEEGLHLLVVVFLSRGRRAPGALRVFPAKHDASALDPVFQVGHIGDQIQQGMQGDPVEADRQPGQIGFGGRFAEIEREADDDADAFLRRIGLVRVQRARTLAQVADHIRGIGVLVFEGVEHDRVQLRADGGLLRRYRVRGGVLRKRGERDRKEGEEEMRAFH